MFFSPNIFYSHNRLRWTGGTAHSITTLENVRMIKQLLMFTRHTLNHSSNLPHDWFCSQGQHKHQSHESREGQLEHVLVGNWPILTNNIKKISVRVELSITIPQDFSLLQWKCHLKVAKQSDFLKKYIFFNINNICKLIYARAFLLTPSAQTICIWKILFTKS